ncbi:MAG: beta-lactamase family protein, partial [Spirochaetia bacterium]|nr:beta-lactamase family protein [Spirochaetia bacterium]
MITVILFAGGLSAAPAWDMSSLDSFAPAVMRKREMGGLQVCVSDKVRSECLAYGVRDTERKPVTPNTYFLGSGLMQPVTALTTGEVAAKSGKKLADVVYKSGSTEIRLEQLLTQTSGFSVAKSSYLAGTKKPELLPQVEYTPGTEFLATPTNYFVMAKLTAEWSGQDFVKSAAAHVRSTGMDLIQNSEGLFLSNGGPLDDVAEGVAAPGSKVFQIQLPETAEPAWDGLWTTARGYSTYLRGLSNSRGKNLFKPLFQYDPALGGSVPGFHLMKDRCGSSILRVEGARGGFVSFAALFEDGRSIVILGNAPHPEVGRELYQFIRKFVWKESCINEETLTAVGEDLDGFYRPNH